MPFPPVPGNAFEVRILRKSHGRSFQTPTAQTGVAVGSVSNHSQKIRNRLWLYPELRDHRCFIAHQVAHAVELHHSRSHNALAEIFVRCANENLGNSIIVRRDRKSTRLNSSHVEI